MTRRAAMVTAGALVAGLLGSASNADAALDSRPNAVAGPDGKAYEVVVDRTVSWSDARAAATAAGGHLVTINSAAEQAFVQQLLANRNAPAGEYWIGLEKCKPTGTGSGSNGGGTGTGTGGTGTGGTGTGGVGTGAGSGGNTGTGGTPVAPAFPTTPPTTPIMPGTGTNTGGTGTNTGGNGGTGAVGGATGGVTGRDVEGPNGSTGAGGGRDGGGRGSDVGSTGSSDVGTGAVDVGTTVTPSNARAISATATGDVSAADYCWITDEPVTYQNWLAGQPDNNGGDETVGGMLWSRPGDSTFDRRGFWNDLPDNYLSMDSVYPDLNNGGYIIEYASAGGVGGDNGGPVNAVPLPPAALAAPLGLLVAWRSRRWATVR